MKKFQPDKIKGINRLRDGKICVLWAKYNKSAKELSEIFKLTERRVQQILKKNHAFVPIDKEWEKRKRIKWFETQIYRREEKKEMSKKDLADLVEQLRKEIEGDGPTILVKNEEHITVYLPGRAKRKGLEAVSETRDISSE